MAPRKTVTDLASLALGSAKTHVSGIFFAHFGLMIANSTLGPQYTQALLGFLQETLFNSTAPTLHEKLATLVLEVLQACLDKLPDQFQPQAKLSTQQLAVLAASPKLSQLGDGRPLSEPIATALLENLEKLSGLRQLKSQSFSRLSDSAFEKRLIDSCYSLKNLVKFSGGDSCTDAIIRAICENCPGISEVTVTMSEKVTDKSMECLATCTQLARVDVADTEVTAKGVARFLAESKSRKLTSIAMECCVLTVLKLLETAASTDPLSQPIQLKELYLDMDQLDEQLRLAAKLCPNLRKISVTNAAVPDLSRLVNLEQLENLNIYVIGDPSVNFHRITDFLRIRGSFITALEIASEVELPVSSVLQLGTLCPNLRELKLDCSWDTADQEPEIQPEPLALIQLADVFPFLEKFHSEQISPAVCRAVLRHAHALKSLDLGIRGGCVDDEFFDHVFQFNPCNQLEDLELALCYHGGNHTSISQTTMENIIRCEALKRIKYWANGECDSSKTLIKNVQQFLRSHNYNVKFSKI